MNIAEQVPAQEAPPVAVEAAVGQAFVAARQAQNLSITDVANRLKLSVHQVQALEQGAYDRLPGAVFVRGFTRNYARLLKLDPEEMVRVVDAHLPRAAERSGSAGETNIPMPAKNSGRWPLVAGVAAVVFLGAALVDVLWPETPSTSSTAAVAPGSPAPPPQAATPAAPSAPSALPADTAAATQASAQSAAAVPASPAVPGAPPSGAVASNNAPTASGNGTVLRLTFDQQSWVQVRDASGTVVLEALYPPGSSREITARPPLTLIVGNAPGVHLTYGDRPIDLAPHTRVAVARLTLE